MLRATAKARGFSGVKPVQAEAEELLVCMNQQQYLFVLGRQVESDTSLCQFNLQASHNGDIHKVFNIMSLFLWIMVGYTMAAHRNNRAFWTLSVFPLNSRTEWAQHLAYSYLLSIFGCEATVKDLKIAYRVRVCTVFYWSFRCSYISGLSKLSIPHLCLSYISNVTVAAMIPETNGELWNVKWRFPGQGKEKIKYEPLDLKKN